MAGFIADDPKDLNIHLACDSDFAGCPYTLRSTSGHHLDIQGPNTRMALSAGSNQQTATAQSSTEAELVSLAHGIKEKGGPAISYLLTITRMIKIGSWLLGCTRITMQL